ncbi:MAG: serine/threonine protein kinase [Planctomyces sp.]|nr:serine/threonine protein kinase [Planctomyces sp.]
MHPERIGPYRIDRKIGAGGMGNVYHGVHEVSGQVAAIKVLPASMAREDGFVQRFEREIAALRQLNNRHIVELYGNGETEDQSYYYAMEFVDGVTLTTEITDRKRLPWQEVIDLSLQIAYALKAAHDAGIVHRDLKPSNLMVTRDRVIKLTDFGVAHVFATTRLTRTGGVVGTAEYMSPEQARGQRATKRSDIYSLGAVMYAMLTGRPPFTGATANDILQKHQFAQCDKPSRYVPEIPRLLEEFVCQLLEKDPARRPADAVVLIRKLEQIRSRIDFSERQLETETIERPAPGVTVRGPSAIDPDVHHPGPATLVRDLLREEARSSLNKSPVARFFDNTFVLIALFGLVVAVGVYLSRRNHVDPNEQFARAQSILKASPGPAWLRARDELLQPLLSVDEMDKHFEEIREMIGQINQYEFTRSLRITSASDGSEQSEIQRQIRRAFEMQSNGDPVEAVRQIDSVLSMIKEDRSYYFLSKFLQETKTQWSTDQNIAGRRAVAQRSLSEARKAQEDGNSERARELVNAILQIYGSDKSMSQEIQYCQEILDKLP